MKKLLLILLCLPMFCATINADNEHLRKYYPNAEKLISRSEIIELSNHNSEIREKILISERKAENDTTGKYMWIRIRPYLDIKFWQKVENKSIKLDELNFKIRVYNNSTIFDELAASKEYDLGEILVSEFENSIDKIFYPPSQFGHLSGLYRTLRTFNEAKQEGTLYIYFLRRIASNLIYVIIFVTAFVLIKFLRKRMRKKTNKILTKEMSEKEITKTISYADELIKLNELKEKGIISEDEFESQKKKVLSDGK